MRVYITGFLLALIVVAALVVIVGTSHHNANTKPEAYKCWGSTVLVKHSDGFWVESPKHHERLCVTEEALKIEETNRVKNKKR